MNLPTILVTGASGFIGNKVAQKLVVAGNRVIALMRRLGNEPNNCAVALGDITDYEPIGEAVARCDVVIHLAGMVGTQPCLNDAHGAIQANVVGTLNILKASRSHKKPVIFGGVGNAEDHSVYAVTKSTAEQFFCMYNKEHGVNTLPLRIFNVYGPGQNTGSGKLIANCIQKGLNGEPLVVFGDGKQVIDFIYVDDVAGAIVRAVEVVMEKHNNQPYHIGTCVGISVGEAVETICRLTGGKSEIVFDEKRGGDVMTEIVADPAKLLPGIDKPRSFEEGIAQTIDNVKEV